MFDNTIIYNYMIIFHPRSPDNMVYLMVPIKYLIWYYFTDSHLT